MSQISHYAIDYSAYSSRLYPYWAFKNHPRRHRRHTDRHPNCPSHSNRVILIQ